MSAPERVWIHSSGKLSVFVRDEISVKRDPRFTPFVPESRALAAEQERDMSRQLCGNAVGNYKALEADLAALREKLRDAERELAIAGVRGSPPPGEDTTIGKWMARAHAAEQERDAARAEYEGREARYLDNDNMAAYLRVKKQRDRMVRDKQERPDAK